ncbi:MAG: hypothetical protein AAGK21_03515 [Bacteroidota bacterium]
MTVRLAILLAGVAWALPARAQIGEDGLRRDTFALAARQGVARLDARPVPGTETVSVLRDTAFVVLEPSAYRLDGTGRFQLAPADSLRFFIIAYRPAPALGPVRARLPSVDSLRAVYAPDTTGRRRPRQPSRAPPAIQTRGTITRGVVAGSNRDASVTSALRLSLAGEVAPGVRLRAALTDEDTPILPEGTTRQLSDLDRVFVEVEGPGVSARLGDVDLALTGSVFAPLARQVQGAVVDARIPATGLVRGGRVLASASATRGRFRSQNLVAIEGVQGPYRLEGDRGEAFVVVVPGSERVYLDGRRLTRGVSGDYTIDYGTGEVTFTPATLIIAESRITVDFEYTAGGFTRTLLASGLDVDLGAASRPGRLGVRLYREADGLTALSEIGLGDVELDLLRGAGDDDVLVSGEVGVAFDPSSPVVLYTRRDTVETGEPIQIFVPARPGDAEVFRVRFTRLGTGRGTYRRVGGAINGILYEYVGPGLGDFVPGRLLPRPASRTLLDVRGTVPLLAGVEAFGEWARSVDDANTLSPVGDDDDAASAVTAGIRLAEVPVAGGVLSGEATWRDRADAFRPLDRVRDVDFNRRWNLSRTGTPLDADTLGEATGEATLRWVRDGATAEVSGGRLALGAFRSDRAALSTLVTGGGRLFQAEGIVSETGGTGPVAEAVGTGQFRRGRAEAGIALGLVQPSVAVEHERRTQTGGVAPVGDALTASYAYLSVRPGLAVDAGGWSGGTSVEWRQESEPLGPTGTEPLANAARAVTVEATGRARGGVGQVDGRLAVRRKTYQEAFRQLGRQNAESVALRLSSRLGLGGGALDGRLVYDALTERAPILQETYVLVGQDLGEFVWRDGEGEPRAGEPDGVAQLDEFFPETTPLEGTYLRTFVPGTDLLPTVGVGVGARLDLRPGRLTESETLTGRLLRALAFRTVVDVRERTRERDVLRVLLLDPSVLQTVGDAGTLDGRFRLEQEVTVFPDLADRGGRVAFDVTTATAQRAVGREERLARTVRAEAYAPLAATVGGRLGVVASRRRVLSDAFASRTFDLSSLALETSLRWTPSERVAVTLAPTVANRTDALASGTRASGALLVRAPAEVRWTRSGRFTAAGRAELSVVTLRGGGEGGLAIFELTDGRGGGTSALWGVDVQLGLTERLRGGLVYDGRAPSSGRAVQTVRVQVSAAL